MLVIGAGPIGLATAAFAAKAGAAHIVVSEIDPQRRARAMKLGATAIIDPKAGPLDKSFAGLAGGPPKVVFECVGVPGVLRQCIEVAARHGRVIVVGVCRHEDTILPRVAIRKELLLQFALGYTIEDFDLSVGLLRSSGFDASAMISGRNVMRSPTCRPCSRACARPTRTARYCCGPRSGEMHRVSV